MLHLTGARRFLMPGIFTLLLVTAVAMVACGGGGSAQSQNASTKPLDKLTFIAGYKPQANLPFVGAYVAQAKGFFKQEGLDVTIRHAQNGEHLQLLMAGEVQVTTADASDVLKRNAQGINAISIALIGQKGEQGFAVMANSGINAVQDFAGKTAGYKGTMPPEFFALLSKANVDPNNIKQVSVGFDPRILTEGKVDVLPVFLSNEPDTLASLGFQVRVFDPNDYAIPMLGLTYITSPQELASNPAVLERFLKAVLEGIYYANDHRDEAVDIVMSYAPDEVRSHQRYMLDTELDRALTGAAKDNGLGWQTKEQWQALNDALVQYKGYDKSVNVTQAFNDTLLKDIYKNGKLTFP
jgi:ABC-type nitrate/sulfonate/bicarbonate transport system substrate-binding protein